MQLRSASQVVATEIRAKNVIALLITCQMLLLMLMLQFQRRNSILYRLYNKSRMGNQPSQQQRGHREEGGCFRPLQNMCFGEDSDDDNQQGQHCNINPRNANQQQDNQSQPQNEVSMQAEKRSVGETIQPTPEISDNRQNPNLQIERSNSMCQFCQSLWDYFTRNTSQNFSVIASTLRQIEIQLESHTLPSQMIRIQEPNLKFDQPLGPQELCMPKRPVLHQDYGFEEASSFQLLLAQPKYEILHYFQNQWQRYNNISEMVNDLKGKVNADQAILSALEINSLKDFLIFYELLDSHEFWEKLHEVQQHFPEFPRPTGDTTELTFESYLHSIGILIGLRWVLVPLFDGRNKKSLREHEKVVNLPKSMDLLRYMIDIYENIAHTCNTIALILSHERIKTGVGFLSLYNSLWNWYQAYLQGVTDRFEVMLDSIQRLYKIFVNADQCLIPHIKFAGVMARFWVQLVFGNVQSRLYESFRDCVSNIYNQGLEKVHADVVREFFQAVSDISFNELDIHDYGVLQIDGTSPLHEFNQLLVKKNMEFVKKNSSTMPADLSKVNRYGSEIKPEVSSLNNNLDTLERGYKKFSDKYQILKQIFPQWYLDQNILNVTLIHFLNEMKQIGSDLCRLYPIPKAQQSESGSKFTSSGAFSQIFQSHDLEDQIQPLAAKAVKQGEKINPQKNQPVQPTKTFEQTGKVFGNKKLLDKDKLMALFLQSSKSFSGEPVTQESTSYGQSEQDKNQSQLKQSAQETFTCLRRFKILQSSIFSTKLIESQEPIQDCELYAQKFPATAKDFLAVLNEEQQHIIDRIVRQLTYIDNRAKINGIPDIKDRQADPEGLKLWLSFSFQYSFEELLFPIMTDDQIKAQNQSIGEQSRKERSWGYGGFIFHEGLKELTEVWVVITPNQAKLKQFSQNLCSKLESSKYLRLRQKLYKDGSQIPERKEEERRMERERKRIFKQKWELKQEYKITEEFEASWDQIKKRAIIYFNNKNYKLPEYQLRAYWKKFIVEKMIDFDEPIRKLPSDLLFYEFTVAVEEEQRMASTG